MVFSLGDLIAFVALILAGYNSYKTRNYQQNEEELLELQKKLSQVQLRRELIIADDSQKADLGARIVKLGSSKYRLKIFNAGEASAYNVSIDFPEDEKFVFEQDVEEKFPMEKLDKQSNVDLVAFRHKSTKSKYQVHLQWENENKISDSKTVFVTF